MIMKLIRKYQKELTFLLVVVLLGQLFFMLISPGFLRPRFEGRVYATIGAMHKTEDLHTLNDAAHYFGQTMIGWLKFPHFFEDLQKKVKFPEGSSLSAHMQERQNIIFTVSSPQPLSMDEVYALKDYIQSKLDSYNDVNQTKFLLTNPDYELATLQKSYGFGAVVALIVSLTLGFAVLFMRKEFKAG